MMPQDGGSWYEESFTSFLAGVLFTRRFISNFEFFELMNKFENLYSVSISSGEDMVVPIHLDDNGIYLNKNYDDIIVINKKKITVRDYLYSLTTSNVRTFFGIPDVKDDNVKICDFLIGKIFTKKYKNRTLKL